MDVWNNYTPIAGVNKEASPYLLKDTEVVDASNFLFENGEARVRPGVVSLGNPVSGAFFGFSFYDGTTPYSILTSSGKLWRLLDDNTASEITGSGISWGSLEYMNAAVVNGELLIGNNPGGLVRWVPGESSYSIISDAPYRYVTGLLTRVVAAYSPSNPRKVAWSATANNLDWTGLGSGYAIIADAPDEITGLGCVNNVLVILRRQGIHLGFATGSSPVFRFESWSRDGVGCHYPSTVCFYANAAFFVGIDDVYLYDLAQVRAVGLPVRKELFNYLRTGTIYQGVVTAYPRTRYHLIPLAEGLPHFVYDVAEDSWSRHTYSFPLSGGWRRFVGNSEELTFLGGGIRRWDENTPCEEEAFLCSKHFLLGEGVWYNIIWKGILLRVWGEAESVHVIHTASQAACDMSFETSQDLSEGTRWRRVFFPCQLPGQDYRFKLEVSPRSTLRITHAAVRYCPGGEFAAA